MEPTKPPPSPFSQVDSGRVRVSSSADGEDPGVKKTRLWVDFSRTVLVPLVIVPLVTAAVTFLGTSLYSDAGNTKVKKQADAKIEAQRGPTNATVEEVTQLRTEMAALAEAVQKLTKAQPPAPRKPKSRAPDPAPAKKAQAEAVQVLQTITDRIADAPPLPKAPPVNAPPPPAPPVVPQK